MQQILIHFLTQRNEEINLFDSVLIKRMRRWGESKTPLLVPVVESLNSQTLREFKPIIGKKI